jgi:2-polyprenyl-3-methyl-5-hydroxy-6-metoxy-1,4-benzoquinol methylase
MLDAPHIPFADIRQNMKELNTINTYLGGHAISIVGIKQLLKSHPANKPITVCEIGCGGGDNLKAIQQWCTRNQIEINFIGIDLKAECIEFARQQCPALNAQWICSDYKATLFNNLQPDIIFSSLFCHHFNEAELITMLQWMQQNSTTGFFINDLQRHPMAYYSIKIITSIFSKSALVKNDAPLSVARGLKKAEWQNLINTAAIENCTIQWKWAFRYLITAAHSRKSMLGESPLRGDSPSIDLKTPLIINS